jgi:hypothetical protein
VNANFVLKSFKYIGEDDPFYGLRNLPVKQFLGHPEYSSE